MSAMVGKNENVLALTGRKVHNVAHAVNLLATQ